MAIWAVRAYLNHRRFRLHSYCTGINAQPMHFAVVGHPVAAVASRLALDLDPPLERFAPVDANPPVALTA